MKLCLCASSGGHLMELIALSDAWRGYADRFWVTFPTADAKSLLAGETVYWAHHPTNRNLPNLARNLRLAWRLLSRERPQVVISTGAGVAVPFIWIAAGLGMTTIFIESLTFTERPSLSGRLVYRFCDHYLVQWPELAECLPRGEFRGQVL